ncbi:hypothetical protein LINPERHAP1_LOCUS19173 [Linum perenne]
MGKTGRPKHAVLSPLNDTKKGTKSDCEVKKRRWRMD